MWPFTPKKKKPTRASRRRRRISGSGIRLNPMDFDEDMFDPFMWLYLVECWENNLYCMAEIVDGILYVDEYAMEEAAQANPEYYEEVYTIGENTPTEDERPTETATEPEPVAEVTSEEDFEPVRTYEPDPEPEGRPDS